MAKRARPQSEAETDTFTVTPLGAGHEVGRSCIIVKYKGKTVMVRPRPRPRGREVPGCTLGRTRGQCAYP